MYVQMNWAPREKDEEVKAIAFSRPKSIVPNVTPELPAKLQTLLDQIDHVSGEPISSQSHF